MKNRQYSLKVFETTIDNEEDFMSFFDTHQILFQDHLIVIKGRMSPTIKAYLEINNFHFINNFTLPIGRSRKALEEEFSLQKEGEKDHLEKEELFHSFNALQSEIDIKEKQLQASNKALKEEKIKNISIQKACQEKLEMLSNKATPSMTIIDNRIRSGQELNIEGDLLLLNRVNSGAVVKTTGSLIATQLIEGSIRCNGQLMMLSISPKANIVFHGVEVDNNLLKSQLNRIELKNREIHITQVTKKETNWA